MGQAEGAERLADAASGSAAHSHAARFDLKRFQQKCAALLRPEPRQKLKARLKAFFVNRQGSTAIEYALVAGGIAVVIIAAVNTLGQNVFNTFFAQIANDL